MRAMTTGALVQIFEDGNPLSQFRSRHLRMAECHHPVCLFANGFAFLGGNRSSARSFCS